MASLFDVFRTGERAKPDNKLYFISASHKKEKTGFVVLPDPDRQPLAHWYTPDVRKAHPFTSFEEADTKAKHLGIRSYAILSNCIG
jgi:hypothetical protein